jgi:hypothetical protein
MLGLSLGKVTCLFCQARVRRREARRAQPTKGAYVCGGCYARWDKAGRRCVACDTAVRGVQDVGLFADRKAFGHADCGGVRVLRA